MINPNCNLGGKVLIGKNGEGKRNFLISIIIAMTLHSQFEAWGVGVGSVMLPMYLLFLLRLNVKLEQEED